MLQNNVTLKEEGRLADGIQKTGSSTSRELEAINVLELRQSLQTQKYTFPPTPHVLSDI